MNRRFFKAPQVFKNRRKSANRDLGFEGFPSITEIPTRLERPTIWVTRGVIHQRVRILCTATASYYIVTHAEMFDLYNAHSPD